MILTGGEIIFLNSGLIVMNKEYILDTKNLNEIKMKINKADNILFFLDYDGTLAPFKADPLSAVILPDIEKELKKLEKSPKYYLNFISGRKLRELKQMINLNRSNYAGSHGLEIDMIFTEEIVYPHQNLKVDALTIKNYEKIKKKYANNEEIDLEDKIFGLALHFQSETKQKKAENELKTIFSGTSYQVLPGREIIEIRPRSWDKGKAVNYISTQIKENFELDNILRIYIGDDRTDEDAFEVLEDGITIYVKNEDNLNTKAKYYLKSPEDTAKLLRKIAGEI